jgi:hypothetical protein
MNQSESIDLLAAALVKFQSTATAVHKNATNPHYKNRYADLAAVIEATRQPLADADLAVVQLPDGDDLVTRVIHKSGQWIASRTPVKSAKPDAQGYGSALTYARRQSALAMLFCATEDDDGQAASRAPQRKATPTQVQAVRKMVAPDDSPGRTVLGSYAEETTRKRIGEMFGGPQFAGYVLEWAMLPERKKPTRVTEFTEAHFASLEKNRAAIEKYIEDQVFAAKNGANAIDDGDIWGGGKV